MSEDITKKINFPKAGTYVVAVSGGVDSMVLLDLFSKRSGHKIIAAHFDHGIRADTAEDRQLIADYCKNKNLELVVGEGHLGPEASEETARNARYQFLGDLKKQYEAAAVITGHHQDDRIETLIFNVVRGAGARGQGPLTSRPKLLRPLLNISRSDILNYAQTYQVPWREDATNLDVNMARNYIRRKLLPLMEHFDSNVRQRLIEFIKKQETLARAKNKQSAVLADKLVAQKPGEVKFKRSQFLILESGAARDLIYYLLTTYFQDSEPTLGLVSRLEHFSKTALPGSKLEIPSHVYAEAGSRFIRIRSS